MCRGTYKDGKQRSAIDKDGKKLKFPGDKGAGSGEREGTGEERRGREEHNALSGAVKGTDGTNGSCSVSPFC